MDPLLRFKYVDMGQEVRRMMSMSPMFGGEHSDGSAPAQRPRQAARDANPRRADEDSEESAPAQTPRPAAPDAKPRRADKHFVDLYREKIIARTKSVMSILDRLYDQELVTSEKYDEVEAKTTTQAQMRVLYNYIRSWGSRDKDIFFKALRDYEAPLIKELKP